MSKDTVISHAEALRLIDAQIGERVYVGFLVARADPDDPQGPAPFVHSVGSLKNMFAPKPPRLEEDVGFYELGAESLYLPPIAGTIHLRDNGLDFRIADTVSIRVAWRGSTEVGNPWSNPADVPRLFAGGKRAQAEIVEASPTGHKVGAGEDERRIWSLRLRVQPDDEPAFEAEAEHGFRLSPDFEAKIERGYSFNMVPEDLSEVEVLYDPDDRGQVIVRPPEAGDSEPDRIRLRGIVGVPLRSQGDDDTPPHSLP